MENLTVQRDIEVITCEILLIRAQVKSMATSAAIETGKRLVEAKEVLKHGGWSEWLKERVDFSQRTATNLMRLYEEYGDGQLSIDGSDKSATIADLSVTQALQLLAIPAGEREEFIEENDVVKMTKRELEAAIKERDNALKKAAEVDKLTEQLEIERQKASRDEKVASREIQRAKELEGQINGLNAQIIKAKEAEKKAKEKLKELKENPTVPQEILDKLKAEAEAEAEKNNAQALEAEKAKASEALAAAQKAQEAAELQAKQSAERAEKLEKQLRMQNPDVAEFKRHFETVQNDIANLNIALNKLRASDAELATKFEAAVNAVFKQQIKE